MDQERSTWVKYLKELALNREPLKENNVLIGIKRSTWVKYLKELLHREPLKENNVLIGIKREARGSNISKN